MGEYPAYDDAVYDAFSTPDARHGAYRSAVHNAAPGKVVLDIGTGRDALWAVEAARAGARHVYAIEAHPAFAAAAASTIDRLGLADQVTVLPGLSQDQTLPVRAELCISEIIGNVASAEGMIPALNDARSRLCTPDCTWIPFRAQTWAAFTDLSLAGAPVLASESLPYIEAVFAAAGAPFDLRLCMSGPVQELLVSPPTLLESLVFDHRRSAPPPSASIVMEISRPPNATGLLLWTRVAVTSSSREIDTLTANSRGWAPVYIPLPGESTLTPSTQSTLTPCVESTWAPSAQSTLTPSPAGSTLTFTRTPSDDGIHPDYEFSRDDRSVVHSRHHGGTFGATDLHRSLFADP
jgi:protein arginine N-methyltransferase 1